MAIAINTNIASLNAQRNLNSSQAGTNEALQRLSSGLRINSAKDDAAGLAISTRFESQIKGLSVAIRNAGDGVSLAQTAEGSLGSMTENLQRVRELALQAANGTNSAADREALQAEAALLIEEIGRVSEGANFNGVNLLDGTLQTSFQVGANAGETISVSIGKLTADTLGVSSKNGVSATGSSAALNVGDLVINGVTVGASRASDDTSSTANAAASAISKAAAINRVSAESGVTAVVDANVVGGSSMTAGVATGSVTLNGTSIDIDTTGSAASSRAAVVSAINAQSDLTGITAVDSGDDALGVSLVAADGRNITLDFGGTLTAANTGLAAAGTATGGVTLVANSGVNDINIAGANTANAGVAAGSYTAGVSTVSSSARYADAQSAAIVAGDEDISGLTATNFGQLATAGQAAVVTSDAVSGASLDFSGVPSGAAISGNVDIGAVPVTYDFSNVAVAGTGTVYTGGVDITTVGLNFSAMEFTVTLDDMSVDIVLDGAFANSAAVATEITNQFNAEFAGAITVTAVADELIFTENNVDGFSGSAFSFAGADGVTLGLGGGGGATTTAGVATETDSISFDLIIDGDVGNAITVTMDQDYTGDLDNTVLLADINGQLGGSITASVNADGFLTFTNNDTTGAASSILLTNITGDDAAAGAAALGLTAGSAFGVDGTDSELTISDGTTEVTIALTADYSLGDGAAATALQTVLNNGLTGTNITASVTSNAGELTVEFAETTNTGSTITVTNGEGTVDGANLFFGAPSATNTGVQAFATAQNLEFTVTDADANTVAINIDTSIADSAALVAEINNQLTAGNVEAFASIDGDGQLNIVSSATGAAAEVTVSAANANAQSVLGLDAAPVTATGSDSTFGTDALSDGDLVINGVSIGAARAADDTASYDAAASSIKEASGISIAAAINRASDSTGVTATVNATTVTGGASTAGTAGDTGTLSVNGIDVTLTVQSNADANRASAVSQINAVSGQTGVIAEDNGSGLTLTAADGRNIVLAFDTNGGASAANFGLGGSNVAESDFTAADVTADQVAVTTYSTVSLSSAGSIEVSGGTNGNAALAGLGLEQGSFGGAVSGQFLNEVDISTQKGAVDALAAIDNALNSVNAARADLGAVQNRFEATISNLEVNSENLSAANSRIRDADFAAEAANLARSQVLQQAGISILAQANSSGEQVLSLLR